MPDIQISDEPIRNFGTSRPKLNINDSPHVEIMLKDSMALHAHKLSEHDGKLAGLSAVVSALQSYKGFLQAVIIGLLAFTLTSFAVLVTLQVRSDGKAEAASSKVSSLEGKVDELPGRISKEIRETSRDLILITNSAANNSSTDGKQRKP